MYKNYGGIENIDKFNQFLPDGKCDFLPDLNHLTTLNT